MHRPYKKDVDQIKDNLTIEAFHDAHNDYSQVVGTQHAKDYYVSKKVITSFIAKENPTSAFHLEENFVVILKNKKLYSTLG